jgi:hypothetical protein
MVQEEFRDTARRKPWEAAVVSHTPEGEAPITIETVPPEECRVGHGAGHRLDGIAHEFANMPEIDHRRFSRRQAAATEMDPELERMPKSTTVVDTRLR